MRLKASVLERTQLFVAALVVGACSPDGDVVGAATDGEDGSGSDSDVDSSSDPGSGSGEIPTSSGALSGYYQMEFFTLSCAGDCSAPGGLLGPISYCDVGAQDTDYDRVDHEGSTLRIDFDEGRAEGTIEDDGSFSLRGMSTQSGGEVDLSATVVGQFSGRHEGFTAVINYTADGFHDGDGINCVGELEVVAIWERDECSNNPSICPDEFPLCVDDGCHAGAADDPCRDPEDCAAGLVCYDRLCRAAGNVGEPCDDEEHCVEGHACVDDVCSAGEPGDPCRTDDDCDSDICVDDVCSAGRPGDACSVQSHCMEDLHCVNDACTVGDNGDPCDFDEHCGSEICYDDACQAGDAGDPCTWDDDCAPGRVCEDDACS